MEVLVFQLNQPVVKVKTDQDGRIVLTQPRTNEWFSLMARGRETVAGVTHYAPFPLKGEPPRIRWCSPSRLWPTRSRAWSSTRRDNLSPEFV